MRPDPSVLLSIAVCGCLSSFALGQQFRELPTKGDLPADNDDTTAIRLADVDGDGDLDILANSSNNARVRLYRNDGSGFYVDMTLAKMPAWSGGVPTGLDVSDIDGDGDPDIIISTTGQNLAYVNDGTGSFADETSTRLPTESESTGEVRLADVDRDNDLDFVIADPARLYLNDGAGVFTNATAGRMPAQVSGVTSMAVADVDGDTAPDLVFGYYLDQTRLWLNDGTGTFADATAGRVPAEFDWTTSIALGDVDGDNDLDMVLGNRVVIFFGSEQNRLFLNDGAGNFTDATGQLPTSTVSTVAVLLRDIDGDSDLDLLMGSYSSVAPPIQNELYLNDGTGNFTDVTSQRLPVEADATVALAIGDVDGDNDADIVLGNTHANATFNGAPASGQNRLYLNDGMATFTNRNPERLPGVQSLTTALAAGDVDGDRDIDLAVGNEFSGQNRLQLNDGTGTFIDATPSRMPVAQDNTKALALKDVDGDDDLDLAVANDNRQNKLYLNDGSGNFTDQTAALLPADLDPTRALLLVDVDGDLDRDLVLGNFGAPDRLYLNDGTGAFTDVTAQQMPPDFRQTEDLAWGDVDGDTDRDLVLGDWTGTRLYLNDGSGSFTDVTAQQMPAGFAVRTLAIGDVDGDADLDLVVGPFTGQNRLFLNDGHGTFSDGTSGRIPPGWPSIAIRLGDMDEDGDLDIVEGNTSASGFQNRLLLNDGTGTFVAAGRLPPDQDRTEALALLDVDGDSDIDIVVGNYQQPNRVYANLHTQLTAPLRAVLGESFQLDFYAKPGYGHSSHTARAVLGFALRPEPLKIPPFGRLYLAAPTFQMPLVTIPQSTGIGTLQLVIPNVPLFVGIELFFQALIIDDSNPADARLSSYTVDTMRSGM